MQNQLVIYIKEEQDYLHWQYLERGQINDIFEGTWQHLLDQMKSEGIENPLTTVILPSERILHCKVELPPNQLKYVHKALPFAIEDKLTKDPDYYHLIPNSKIKNGKLPVIAIDLEYITDLRETMSELGLQPAAAYLDTEILYREDALTVTFIEDRALISGEDFNMGAEVTWAGQAVELFSEAEGDIANLNLVYHETLESPDIIKAQLQSFVETEIVVERFSGELLSYLVDKLQARRSQLTNIFSGQFSFRKESNNQFGFLKPIAVAASIGLMVFLGSTVVETQRKMALAEGYAQANESICKDIFGPQKKCRENLLRREVQNLLAGNTGQAKGAGFEFLPTVDTLATTKAGSLELNSIRYTKDRTELLAVIRGNNFQELEKLKNDLVSKGLNADLSASQDAGKTRGNFKISKGGA